MTANSATGTIAAHEIEKSIRHIRRLLEQVTGRANYHGSEYAKAISRFQDGWLCQRKLCVLSLRDTPE
jgi:hypothetical protein